MLDPNWDARIVGALGFAASQSFGIIRDPEAHDEELDWVFVFFPLGRQSSTRLSLIVEVGSWERMENILEELAKTREFKLPKDFDKFYPGGSMKLPK